MSRSILLASFVTKKDLYSALDKISSEAKVDKDKIFVFLNEEDNGEYILTYNMNSDYANIKFTSIWENTISIHRKKQTNTLYSLNAMNELIKSKTGGMVDKNYRVRWEDYRGKLLIIKGGRLKVLPVRLVKINQ